jgi:hypothetical protein
MENGSATSAYSDFPVAVLYMAAVTYLIDYWKTKAEGSLRLFALLAAVLPWVKQEGSLLWVCLAGLALAKVAQDRRIRPVVIAVIPGAITLVGWNLIVRLVHAPAGQDFLPFTFSTIRSNLGRGPEIVQVLADEMVYWRYWSLLWPGLILAAPLFLTRSSRKQPVALLLAVTLPVILYSAVFLFSAWSPYIDHVNRTISRLLLHVSLVAILILGLAVPIGFNDQACVPSARKQIRKGGKNKRNTSVLSQK